MKLNLTHEQKIDFAKKKITRTDFEYLDVVVDSLGYLPMEESKGIELTADGNILYNPAFVESVTVRQLSTHIAIAVIQWLTEVPERAKKVKESSAERYSKAATYEVFTDITEKIGTGQNNFVKGVNYPKYDDKELTPNNTAEYYFSRLKHDKKDKKGGKKSPQVSASGSGQTQGQGQPQPQKDSKPSQPDHKGQPNRVGPSEAQSKHKENVKSDKSIPTMTKVQQNALRQFTADRLEGTDPGTIPLGMRMWLDNIRKPPFINWKQILRHYISLTAKKVRGRKFRTFSKMHRRSAAYGKFGFLRKGTYSKKMKIGVAIDTSGSMGKGELETALDEIQGILDVTRCSIRLYACDADIHVSDDVSNIKEAAAGFVGGGGTDFIPVFNYIEEKKEDIDLLIYITDGGGCAPAKPPKRTDVIWCLVGAHRDIPHFSGAAPWGKILQCSNEVNYYEAP